MCSFIQMVQKKEHNSILQWFIQQACILLYRTKLVQVEKGGTSCKAKDPAVQLYINHVLDLVLFHILLRSCFKERNTKPQTKHDLYERKTTSYKTSKIK